MHSKDKPEKEMCGRALTRRSKEKPGQQNEPGEAIMNILRSHQINNWHITTQSTTTSGNIVECLTACGKCMKKNWPDKMGFMETSIDSFITFL